MAGPPVAALALEGVTPLRMFWILAPGRPKVEPSGLGGAGAGPGGGLYEGTKELGDGALTGGGPGAGPGGKAPATALAVSGVGGPIGAAGIGFGFGALKFIAIVSRSPRLPIYHKSLVRYSKPRTRRVFQYCA